ncbi:N-acetyltransferase family protein [Agromyces sp. Marseille-Q5079]|uniref:GNAT family N-acetyltransferase n=1 Tax=Agromyces sp. Marseille-Q5079 TaxID=3439059 RepID=UPI003D9CBC41
MTKVTVRRMTPAEFDHWQATLAEDYAREQVAAGRWPEDGAVQRAREENEQLLPDGLATARTLILRGIDADGDPVGVAWVALDHPRGAPDVAFLYDIEVIPARRGHGLGRALLAAVEDAAEEAGAAALELNVFGGNRAAVALYGSSGYEVVTQQMRKAL